MDSTPFRQIAEMTKAILDRRELFFRPQPPIDTQREQYRRALGRAKTLKAVNKAFAKIPPWWGTPADSGTSLAILFGPISRRCDEAILSLSLDGRDTAADLLKERRAGVLDSIRWLIDHPPLPGNGDARPMNALRRLHVLFAKTAAELEFEKRDLSKVQKRADSSVDTAEKYIRKTDGCSLVQIANELSIEPRSVKNHILPQLDERGLIRPGRGSRRGYSMGK